MEAEGRGQCPGPWATEGVCRMGPVPQGGPGTRGLETVMTSKSKEADFCPTPGTCKHGRTVEG